MEGPGNQKYQTRHNPGKDSHFAFNSQQGAGDEADGDDTSPHECYRPEAVYRGRLRSRHNIAEEMEIIQRVGFVHDFTLFLGVLLN